MSVLLSDSTYEHVKKMISDLLDEWGKISDEVARNHPGNPSAIKWATTQKLVREIADFLENKAKHFSEIAQLQADELNPLLLLSEQIQMEFENAAKEIRAKYGVK